MCDKNSLNFPSKSYLPNHKNFAKPAEYGIINLSVPVAQLEECQFPKLKVAGSIPVGCAKSIEADYVNSIVGFLHQNKACLINRFALSSTFFTFLNALATKSILKCFVVVGLSRVAYPKSLFGKQALSCCNETCVYY